MDQKNSMNAEKNYNTSSTAGASGNGGSYSRKAGEISDKAGNRADEAGFATIGDAIHKVGASVDNFDKSKITKQASTWLSDVSERAQDFDTDVKNFVRERPLTVLAGAVAVGFVASKLLTSMKKSA